MWAQIFIAGPKSGLLYLKYCRYLKNIFFVPFFILFIWKFIIYWFFLNQVIWSPIYGRLVTDGYRLSVIKIYEIPHFSFIIKILNDVYGAYRIVEDRFYFRGIILLTCRKKGTLGMNVLTVNCLIFIIMSSIYRYVKYIKRNHCVAPFLIFNHCFIDLHCNVFSNFTLVYINSCS